MQGRVAQLEMKTSTRHYCDGRSIRGLLREIVKAPQVLRLVSWKPSQVCGFLNGMLICNNLSKRLDEAPIRALACLPKMLLSLLEMKVADRSCFRSYWIG